ncbi:ArsR/SmtB family transcription factor [Streptomyces himalayensis]|uniref:Winged helix-turn-helix transcriptional regulator n=1 Tax=Streptomyces himalayensis subsp. himalayensis TaxID=2756131 RepID=A0A7W0I964_9ACTN|nr:winged helix-turn-helix domain-containing protein [Streptomyces himalayensis]MBA2947072.1 winged helix-turn-helix transcriptional regulator [Streptomyces himalayensis subsp. himalayensis]
MLRIHFTDADLARTRIAAVPDPLWEICASLHRFQSRQGRWAYADWFRTARTRLHAAGFAPTLRTLLLPLVPRAAYFPDFLTPPEATEGLDAGLEAILATPKRRILDEVGILARTSGAPAWAPSLAEPDMRKELVQAMRAYHDTVIAPHSDHIQARIEAERSARARAMLNGGIDGVLQSLGPDLRWQRPILHTVYPEDRDLHLNGRGLLLVPSYFCWGNPVTFGDTTLDPILIYSLSHEPHHSALPGDLGSGASLKALLGRTRAAVLRAAATGATTGELARATGVSASSASQHATALRDAGLITSHRHAASVLHTLTPLGAALLRANTPGSP